MYINLFIYVRRIGFFWRLVSSEGTKRVSYLKLKLYNYSVMLDRWPEVLFGTAEDLDMVEYVDKPNIQNSLIRLIVKTPPGPIFRHLRIIKG